MNPHPIEGATRIVGGPDAGQPEYLPLHIRDMPAEIMLASGRVSTVNAMVTAWRPTADELAALNAGAPVYLSILGNTWPPANLWVGGAA